MKEGENTHPLQTHSLVEKTGISAPVGQNLLARHEAKSRYPVVDSNKDERLVLCHGFVDKTGSIVRRSPSKLSSIPRYQHVSTLAVYDPAYLKSTAEYPEENGKSCISFGSSRTGYVDSQAIFCLSSYCLKERRVQ